MALGARYVADKYALEPHHMGYLSSFNVRARPAPRAPRPFASKRVQPAPLLSSVNERAPRAPLYVFSAREHKAAEPERKATEGGPRARAQSVVSLGNSLFGVAAVARHFGEERTLQVRPVRGVQ